MLEAIGNNPALLLLLLLVGTALTGGATLWRLRGEWALFRAWRLAGMPDAPQIAPDAPGATEPAYRVAFDPAPLPGAGHALKHPPSDLRAVLAQVKAAGGRYRIPLGWVTGGLATAQLVGDVNHILISGASDSGKDNAVMGMLLTLASTHTPQAAQFCIIDGKGLDWAGWEHKAHCWRVALEPEEIAPAMLAITEERRRRGTILRAAGVAKWDEYQGDNLPLLVVFISELSLLEDCTKASELTAWLNSELSAGRAFGLRFIIGTQNASNFSTRWRGQIGLFLAGYQASRAADEPNTGLTASDLTELGAIAPSQLPPPPGGAGVFVAAQGRNVATVRASLLPSQHRAWVLSTLPDKALQRTAPPTRPAPAAAPAGDMAILQELLHAGAALPLASELVEPSYRAMQSGNRTAVEQSSARSTAHNPRSDDGAAMSYVELPLPAEVVPFDEQRRIIEAAPGVKSKRQLSLALYNVDGGQKSTWVRLVCDALGLLQPQP